MYHIKNDQRAVRSSQMLYEALTNLMYEKPFDTITVTDLVDMAQVGRATFYRNFDEMEDILRMRCDQTFEGLISYFKAYLQTHAEQSETGLLKPLLRYFYLHSEIIELLLIAKRIDIIQDSFHMTMEPFKTQLSALHNIAEEFVE
jgi:AcrR family transcriptional regulator